jgi:ABC-type antimicrobial peptide transport system permease subunit
MLSALALLLARAGLYAAVAYAVSQRQGELAVRLALGASARDVMTLVLRDPLMTTAIGVTAGIPCAYITMRSAASLLFGVPPFDIQIIFLCTAVLLIAGLLAALWPARRAIAIDPVAVLRNG